MIVDKNSQDVKDAIRKAQISAAIEMIMAKDSKLSEDQKIFVAKIIFKLDTYNLVISDKISNRYFENIDLSSLNNDFIDNLTKALLAAGKDKDANKLSDMVEKNISEVISSIIADEENKTEIANVLEKSENSQAKTDENTGLNNELKPNNQSRLSTSIGDLNMMNNMKLDESSEEFKFVNDSLCDAQIYAALDIIGDKKNQLSENQKIFVAKIIHELQKRIKSFDNYSAKERISDNIQSLFSKEIELNKIDKAFVNKIKTNLGDELANSMLQPDDDSGDEENQSNYVFEFKSNFSPDEDKQKKINEFKSLMNGYASQMIDTVLFNAAKQAIAAPLNEYIDMRVKLDSGQGGYSPDNIEKNINRLVSEIIKNIEHFSGKKNKAEIAKALMSLASNLTKFRFNKDVDNNEINRFIGCLKQTDMPIDENEVRNYVLNKIKQSQQPIGGSKMMNGVNDTENTGNNNDVEEKNVVDNVADNKNMNTPQPHSTTVLGSEGGDSKYDLPVQNDINAPAENKNNLNQNDNLDEKDNGELNANDNADEDIIPLPPPLKNLIEDKVKAVEDANKSLKKLTGKDNVDKNNGFFDDFDQSVKKNNGLIYCLQGLTQDERSKIDTGLYENAIWMAHQSLVQQAIIKLKYTEVSPIEIIECNRVYGRVEKFSSQNSNIKINYDFYDFKGEIEQLSNLLKSKEQVVLDKKEATNDVAKETTVSSGKISVEEYVKEAKKTYSLINEVNVDMQAPQYQPLPISILNIPRLKKDVEAAEKASGNEKNTAETNLNVAKEVQKVIKDYSEKAKGCLSQIGKLIRDGNDDQQNIQSQVSKIKAIADKAARLVVESNQEEQEAVYVSSLLKELREKYVDKMLYKNSELRKKELLERLNCYKSKVNNELQQDITETINQYNKKHKAIRQSGIRAFQKILNAQASKNALVVAKVPFEAITAEWKPYNKPSKIDAIEEAPKEVMAAFYPAGSQLGSSWKCSGDALWLQYQPLGLFNFKKNEAMRKAFPAYLQAFLRGVLEPDGSLPNKLHIYNFNNNTETMKETLCAFLALSEYGLKDVVYHEGIDDKKGCLVSVQDVYREIMQLSSSENSEMHQEINGKKIRFDKNDIKRFRELQAQFKDVLDGEIENSEDEQLKNAVNQKINELSSTSNITKQIGGKGDNQSLNNQKQEPNNQPPQNNNNQQNNQQNNNVPAPPVTNTPS